MSTFPGEDFLATGDLPSYESDRTVVYALLTFLTVFWLVYIPVTLKKRSIDLFGLSTPLTTAAWLGTSLAVIAHLNPHNSYPLRRVFSAPVFKAADCQDILNMASRVSYRNVERLANSTPELLEYPVGWFKKRDPIYPTTDLHFLLDEFTQEERDYMEELLDRRLAPIVSRVYGLPTSQLRVNDLFLVRYDESKKVSLKPHTDNSDISFNVLLSNNFTEGGTRFFHRTVGGEERDHAPFALVRPRPGDCLMHGSQILHEGFPITTGTRIILVGFFSIDRVNPFSGTQGNTGLPWLASWWCLSWLHVKLRDSYIFSNRRVTKEHSESIWDHVYLQALRRDLINFVTMVGDYLGVHEVVSLVDHSHYDDYFEALDRQYRKSGTNWFRGQHIDVDFTGRIADLWISRKRKAQKFTQSEL